MSSAPSECAASITAGSAARAGLWLRAHASSDASAVRRFMRDSFRADGTGGGARRIGAAATKFYDLAIPVGTTEDLCMLDRAAVAREEGALKPQQRRAGIDAEPARVTRGRRDRTGYLNRLEHRKRVGCGDHADERVLPHARAPVAWQCLRQKTGNVDHRIGVGQTIRDADDADAQCLFGIREAERASHRPVARHLYGIDDW